jgi:hypothetical protein
MGFPGCTKWSNFQDCLWGRAPEGLSPARRRCSVSYFLPLARRRLSGRAQEAAWHARMQV